MAASTSNAFGPSRRITVTILGKSGAGKTVLLSSMYCELRDGRFGFRAEPTEDDTDIELGTYVKRLFIDDEVPPGTTSNELHYTFALSFNSELLAQLDLFDFRGGALEDNAQKVEAGKILSQRIASSDIIIWLLDLSETANLDASDVRRARLVTSVGRLQAITSQATAKNPRLRVWCFVRAKVDRDFPDLSEENLLDATGQLHAHLGDVLSICMYNNKPYASLMSVAPVGKVEEKDGHFRAGMTPVNPEWPLLQSVAMLMQARLLDLDDTLDGASGANERGGGGFLGIRKRTERPEIKEASSMAEAEAERMLITRALEVLVRNQPKSVRVLEMPADGAA